MYTVSECERDRVTWTRVYAASQETSFCKKILRSPKSGRSVVESTLASRRLASLMATMGMPLLVSVRSGRSLVACPFGKLFSESSCGAVFLAMGTFIRLLHVHGFGTPIRFGSRPGMRVAWSEEERGRFGQKRCRFILRHKLRLDPDRKRLLWGHRAKFQWEVFGTRTRKREAATETVLGTAAEWC